MKAVDIDWTGVEPDQSPVRPLDAHTFATRLRLLTDRVESLTILRKASTEQSSSGEHLLRRSVR
jgi:hypothetical protein